MSNIHLFGPRVLLKFEKPSETKFDRVIIPDSAGKSDMNRMGKVVVVGNGRVTNQITKETEHRPSLVSAGDLVMFQINDVMKWAQIYRHNTDDLIHMLQAELVARINGEKISLETFEILGDYSLVKPEIESMRGKLHLPDTLRTADMIRYICVQKGSTVELPFEVGQELICNHGRMNPIFIPVKQEDGTMKQEEFAYVLKDFIHGVVPIPAKPAAN